MAGKLPYFQFYPGDWLRDGISGCSLAAQGLWLRMMIVGHDSERYGYLSMNGSPMQAESIARRVGCSLPEFEALLAELDAAGVPSRTPDKIIFSRRMVRDQQARELNAKRQKRHYDKVTNSNASSNAEPNGTLTPIEDESEIERVCLKIYELYPRKVGKAIALKAIRRALCKERPEVLEDAVKAFAEARKDQEMRYTPHPATWFNQERWGDDRASWVVVNGHERQNDSAEAVQAYLHACKAVKECGVMWVMSFKDKAIEGAIREIGGWRKFCDWSTHETQFRQKEFVGAYTRLKQT